MEAHPDKLFCQYILVGLLKGFRIGFDYSHHCVSASHTLQSAETPPQVIHDYIQKERDLGRVRGPVAAGAVQDLQVSPFGVIPKPHAPGKWRLIVDLSHPAGRSVNDGIRSSLTSLSYVSVDNLAEVVLALGKGAQTAKLDIKSAFRVVPVFPEDRLLLGLKWEGRVFVDSPSIWPLLCS